MIEKIVNYSIKNKSLIFIILIFLILFGTYSYIVADREVFPNVDLSTVIIQSEDPNTNAKTIYTSLTEPIYNAIKSINGIKTVQENADNNYTTLVVTTHYGVSLSKIEQSINQNLTSIKLPQGATTPTVSEFSFSNLPILQISISGKGKNAFVKNTLSKDVSDINGVQSISYYGDKANELKIYINFQNLQKYNISYKTLLGIISSLDINNSIGNIPNGKDTTEPLVVYSNINSINDLLNTPIGFSNGSKVYLKNVATAQIQDSYQNQIVKTNNKSAILFNVYGQNNVNTIQVIQSVLSKLNSTKPKSINYQILQNDTSTINSTINSILRETLLGIVLAVLIIYIFLKSPDTTLIASLSIPISFLFTLVLMNVQNITFNIMSLSGLSVALGRIVDDSIVVIENIFRHLSEKKEKKDVSLIVNSVKEVGGAITSSTLTTIGVFLPIAFVGGITSSFFIPFAFTASSALIASLFTAIIVIPLFARIFLLKKKVKLKEKEFFLVKYYDRFLRITLRHKFITIVITLVLVGLSLLLIPFIKTGFIPSPSQPDATISGTLKVGTSKSETLAEAEKIGNYLHSISDVELYSIQVGATQRGILNSTLNNEFQIFVSFKNSNNINNIISQIENFTNKQKGLNSQVNLLSAVGNLNSVSLIVNTSNQKNLYNATEYLASHLKSNKGISNVTSNLSKDTYQKKIVLLSKNLSKYDLSSIQVLSQIQYYFTPYEIQQYSIGSNNYDTYIYVNNLPNLENINIQNPLGINIPLSKISTIKDVSYSSNITYQNGERASNINALITSTDTEKTNNYILSYISKTQKKYNVTVKNQGSSSEQSSSFDSLFEAMGISVFIVLIIMVATFSSITEPLAILSSLPVTVIGIFVALYITGSTLNLPALIGMLMLIGIVVTNAIVLLVKIKQNIESGEDMQEAIIRGGRIRLRPILMTAVTTIFALLPLAIFSSNSSLIGQSLAITVIGGLFTSTFLTLFIVPVVYSSIKRVKY
jgi:multidrug efflux pump subunit AcrB